MVSLKVENHVMMEIWSMVMVAAILVQLRLFVETELWKVVKLVMTEIR